MPQNYTFLDKLQLSEESRKNKGLSNLQKRARVKYIQTPKLKLLLNHATSIGDNAKGYQRALNCADGLIYDNGKYKSHYCFNRIYSRLIFGLIDRNIIIIKGNIIIAISH